MPAAASLSSSGPIEDITSSGSLLSGEPFPSSLAAFQRTSVAADKQGGPFASSRNTRKAGGARLPFPPQPRPPLSRNVHAAADTNKVATAEHRVSNHSVKLPRIASNTARVTSSTRSFTSRKSSRGSKMATQRGSHSSRPQSRSGKETRSLRGSSLPVTAAQKKSTSGRRAPNSACATRGHVSASLSTSQQHHPSRSSYAHRSGPAVDVAVVRIQRAVRQTLLCSESRTRVAGLAERVRQRMKVEAQLEAIRVRVAKRRLASFFSSLSAVNARYVAKLRAEINTKAAEVVQSFLRARQSLALRASRRRVVEQTAVRRIERAWLRSPLYDTVTTLSQDCHAQRLLIRHETLERRELMRRRLAYIVLRHQQLYNDPQMVEEGLATRHVPLTASSILFGAGNDEDEGRLAILLGQSFRDDVTRTLRLFERRTFFSAQESQLLIEENLLEVAPLTYEKPMRWSDVFNFETFIHEQYALLMQRQEAERTARDASGTSGYGGAGKRSVLSSNTTGDCPDEEADGLRLIQTEGHTTHHFQADAESTIPPPDPTGNSRRDAAALATQAYADGILLCSELGGSRSHAYQAVLDGVAPSTSPLVRRITFEDVKDAVDGVRNVALAPPTENSLFVEPRFHSCALFRTLVQRQDTCEAPVDATKEAVWSTRAAGSSSALRLGPLADATTARFLSPRDANDDGHDTSARTPRGASFCTSAHALGMEWVRWLRTCHGTQSVPDVMSRSARTDRAQVSSPTASLATVSASRVRRQCILDAGSTTNSCASPTSEGFLLDDFLHHAQPIGRIAPDTHSSIPSSRVANAEGMQPAYNLYDVERMLVQEHRYREHLSGTWEHQWHSLVILAKLQRPRNDNVN